jgi:hypothetical protein
MSALITRRKVLIAAPAVLLLPRHALAQTSTTWNPSDKNVSITLSNGNLTATGSLIQTNVRCQNPQSTGQYYVEIHLDNFPSPSGYSPVGLGVANASHSLATGQYLGIDTNSYGFYLNNANQVYNNVIPVPGAAGAFGTQNSIVGVSGDNIYLAVDATNGACYFGNVTTPVATQGFKPLQFPVNQAIMVAFDCEVAAASMAVTANFGATAFTGTPPAEFASGWGVTPITSPTCRWSVARSSRYCNISGTLSNVVDHGVQDNWHRAATTIFHNTGKYYGEFDITRIGTSNNWKVGVSAPWGYLNSFGADVDNSGIVWDAGNGVVTKNNATVTTIQTATTGDTVCMATDFDNKKIWWRKGSGNWNNDVIANQNPATNTGGVDITTIVSAAVMLGPTWAGLTQNASSSGAVCTARFGQLGFSQAIPSGFSPWAPTAATGSSRGYIIQ